MNKFNACWRVYLLIFSYVISNFFLLSVLHQKLWRNGSAREKNQPKKKSLITWGDFRRLSQNKCTICEEFICFEIVLKSFWNVAAISMCLWWRFALLLLSLREHIISHHQWWTANGRQMCDAHMHRASNDSHFHTQ